MSYSRIENTLVLPATEGCFFMSLHMKQVKKYIGSRLLLDIPTLSLSGNQRVGIVGSNGSGKTTFLNMIAGTQAYDEGQIHLDGTATMITQLLDETSVKSGGEQTKIKIRESMTSLGETLLADEPTNHLDQPGREYLLHQLQRYQGLVMIVSHDRHFLNEVCDHIIEIKDGNVRLYEGNYDTYLEQKGIEEREHQRHYENYQREKASLEEAVDTLRGKSHNIKKAPSRMGNSEARLHKRGKGQTAKKALNKQITAMETRLEKMAVVQEQRKEAPIYIPFGDSQVIHRKTVITASDLQLKVGKKPLIKGGGFTICPGDHVALIGPNGSGKTTLLKAILEGHPMIDRAKKATLGYYSQSFEQLEEEDTVFDNVQSTSLYSPQDTRDLLAHLLIKGEDMMKPLQVLSGGEKTKVALAKLILSDNNVLILDEPTNHLDLDSLLALEHALRSYQGTLLFVSHDQAFIQNVANKVIEIKGHRLIAPEEEQIASIANQDRLVLEMRKTSLLSELSVETDNHKKEELEYALNQVLQALK